MIKLIYLFYLSILFIALQGCDSQKQIDQKDKEKDSTEIFLNPSVISLSDLPDSLLPNVTLTDTLPKPKTIALPVTTFPYSYINSAGKKIDLILKPPTITDVPILVNKKGEPEKDSLGNTFVMGEGGLSTFTNYTTDDGLALDGVSCSVMDSKGNMWFGTQGGGVSKYDGQKFTNYTTDHGLANNSVMSLIEDKKGNMWFGTNGGGVSKFDGLTFVNYNTENGLANNSVYSICEDSSGYLWFGTNGGGVSRYKDNEFKTYTSKDGLANNFVMSIYSDSQNNIWFGTNGSGVSKYDGKKFKTFKVKEKLANDWVRAISQDKTGNMWFGTQGGGISKYDGETFTNYSTKNGLANNSVMCIMHDKQNKIWFGTNGGGVSIFDGKKFTSYSTGQGLTNNAVYSICLDKNENIWISTFGGGVSRFAGGAFTKYTTDFGLTNNIIFSILEDNKGDLWFGSNGGGISKYDGKSFTNYSTAQGLVDKYITSIIQDSRQNIWIGTNGGGISKFDGKNFTNFTKDHGLPNNQIFSIAEDKNGDLWFASYDAGVVKYDGKSFVNYTTKQGLSNNIVWSILKDKNDNLWFGTLGGGISVFDGNSFITLNKDQGLSDDNIYSLFEDKKGNVWVGTADGLNVISAEDIKQLKQKSVIPKKLFKTFNTSDGLPDNIITQVKEMKNGKIAIGTNLGITTFDLNKDYESLENIQIYNSTTEYPVKDVNAGQNGMYLTKQGILWAGTGNEKTGLIRFDSKKLNTSNRIPLLELKSIKVNDKTVIWNGIINNSKTDSINISRNITEEMTSLGKSLTDLERDSLFSEFGDVEFDSISPFNYIPQNLVLPYSLNHLTIDFGAIETGRPNQVYYQYILEGYDKEWSPILNKTSANFGNIGEGDYVFKVKVRSPQGDWSKPITYTFTVLPPWYRTWWAYLIYIISAFILIYSIFKWRIAILQKEKEALEEIVVERTAEVVAEKQEADRQRDRSDNLLLNILPAEIAEELKEKGSSDAKEFDMVTILFTDFKGFTQASEKLTAKELVEEIDTCFKYFDSVCGKYNVEKIKTIGDAYMAAGGLPVPYEGSVKNTILAALEMSEFIKERKIQKENEGKIPFEMRLGIHTGPVVAGIVGIKKFAYDIWGDTVNTASRMESSGEPGHVNISQNTYEIMKDDSEFKFTSRGKIIAKGKGELEMFFVEKVN